MTDVWALRLEQLRAFQVANGDVMVNPAKDAELHTWLSEQHRLYLNGIMTADRNAKLYNMGIRWDIDEKVAATFKDSWEVGYRQLKAFHEVTGHARVPEMVSSPLVAWILQQKKRFREKKISSDRFEKLHDLGLDWTITESNMKNTAEKQEIPQNQLETFIPTVQCLNDGEWSDMFEELKQFMHTSGHANVPSSEHPNLRAWLVRQKGLCEEGKLEVDRYGQLVSLGIVWSSLLDRELNATVDPLYTTISKQKTWDEHYEELKAFYNANGHVQVTKSQNESLYFWVLRQKDLFKGRDLPKKLHDLGMTLKNGILQLAVDETTTARSLLGNAREEPKVKKKKPVTKNSHNQKWQSTLEELRKFADANGHTQVPRTENSKLYTWLIRQKAKFREGDLESERYHQLKLLNIDWCSSSVKREGPAGAKSKSHERLWMQNCARLQSFKIENNHLNVPRSDRTLYEWIIRQQTLYRTGKMAQDRYEKLHELGLPLSVHTPSRQNVWDKRFDQLKVFKEKSGHCSVKQSENLSLYDWVHRQRKALREGNLHQVRHERMVALGVDFLSSNRDVAWDARFSELEQFATDNGHVNVKATESISLYSWAKSQRSLHKDGVLPYDKYLKLLALGYDFKSNTESAWEDSFTELKAYQSETGHINVLWSDRRSLYSWIIKQRALHRSGRLQASRYKRMMALGIDFSIPSLWESRYQEAREFLNENGHLNVRTAENRGLYHWIYAQRRSQRDGKLSYENHEKLEAIGFDWDECAAQSEDENENDRKPSAEAVGSVSKHSLSEKPASSSGRKRAKYDDAMEENILDSTTAENIDCSSQPSITHKPSRLPLAGCGLKLLLDLAVPMENGQDTVVKQIVCGSNHNTSNSMGNHVSDSSDFGNYTEDRNESEDTEDTCTHSNRNTTGSVEHLLDSQIVISDPGEASHIGENRRNKPTIQQLLEAALLEETVA